MKTITKSDINKGLANIYAKYCGSGISSNDCKTELERLFLDLLHQKNSYGCNDFSYLTKKEKFNVIYKHYGIEVNAHKEFTKETGGVIIRNLPANDKYILVDAGSYGEGDYWCCENCGRVIHNWNEVQNEAGKKFIVGSECIHTVLKYDNTPDWETSQKLAELNKEKNFMQRVNKNVKNGGRIELDETGKHYYIYDERNRYMGHYPVVLHDKYNRKGLTK